MDFFTPYLDRITELCRQHKVSRLSAFGSSIKGGMTEKSDVDLVVDIDSNDPYEYSDHYFSLYDQLEALFQRPIDLLEERALRNKYFIRELNAQKVDLYEA